jgi:tetratricopeptide (TPR) repeat protein
MKYTTSLFSRLGLSATACLALFASLIVPASTQAFGHSYGYTYNTGYGFSQPYFGQSVHYSTFTPAYAMGGYEQLTDEDMYLGSKRKGDRNMKRGLFSVATREYRNALKRASQFWGAKSTQAKEARSLLTQAQNSFQKYGDARPNQGYDRAKSKGDRFFDRGNFQRALAQYQDALKRAHTDEQAQQAVAMVVRAKDAITGVPAQRRQETLDQRARGDEAMQSGDYQQALGFYASALTRSIKLNGADSRETMALTKMITRAQEGLTGKLAPQSDFRMAD